MLKMFSHSALVIRRSCNHWFFFIFLFYLLILVICLRTLLFTRLLTEINVMEEDDSKVYILYNKIKVREIKRKIFMYSQLVSKAVF